MNRNSRTAITKDAWSCWHSSFRALSNKLSLVKQVLPGRKPPGIKLILHSASWVALTADHFMPYFISGYTF